MGDRINCRFARPKTHNLRKSLLERYGQLRRGNWRLGKFVFQLAAYCLLTQLPAMAAAKEVRRVLIVHSLGFSSPASVLVDTRIRAALENSPYQIELYEETLQNILFSDPASQQEVRQGYIHKYRDRRPDVIIAIGPAPIKFMVESHDEFRHQYSDRVLCEHRRASRTI